MQKGSRKELGLKSLFLKVLLPLFLGAAIFYWVFRSFDFSLFFRHLEHPVIWFCLLVSFLINFCCHWLRAYRWTLLLKPIEEEVPLRKALGSIMVGYLVSLVIPRAGELSRVGLVSKRQLGSYTRIFGTVIAERLTDVVCLFLMISLVAIIQWKLLSSFLQERVFNPLWTKLEAWGGLWLIVSIVLAGFLILWLTNKWLLQKREDQVSGLAIRLAEGLGSIRKLDRPLLFIASTIGIWVCYFLLTYTWFFGFSETRDLGPMAGATLHTFGSIARTIPLVAGSAGAYHEFFAAGASLYHIDKESALSMALLVHGASTLFTILSGGISWLFFSLNPGTYQQSKST